MQEALRRRHLGVLLDRVHIHGPASRAELTAYTGLNRSTVAGLVGELSALGAVREVAPAPGRSGAGRPSPIVEPHAEGVQVIAADVAVDRLVVALVGLGGVVTARRRLSLTSVEPQHVAALLGDVVAELTAGVGPGRHIVGLGVALPGVVRHEDGFVRFAPNLRWVDSPFGQMVAERVRPLPVRVGNDAELGALAEHLRGAGQGVDDLVFVSVDVGVGGGFFVAGRPLQGAGGYAGEVGHLPVRPNGGLCRCGSRGCWETEVGSAAIARALGMSEDSHPEDLARAILATEGTDDRALGEVATWLGVGLGGVVNLLNPRLIVLGGLFREVLQVAGGRVREALDETALLASSGQVGLAVPQLGDDTMLLGAAELALRDVLADPLGVLTGGAHLDSHEAGAQQAGSHSSGSHSAGSHEVVTSVVGGRAQDGPMTVDDDQGSDEQAHAGARRASGPPGWPAQVRPPGGPGWQRSAVAWLLDQCPPEYRDYAVLGRHPLALAQVAAHHVAGAREASARAAAAARVELSPHLPPEAVREVLEALDVEQARLLAAERAVRLVTEALEGRRHVPRL